MSDPTAAALDFLARNGINANAKAGVSIPSLSLLLNARPNLTLAELKQLPEGKALTGANGGAVEFHDQALQMLGQFGAGNNTLTFFIDRGGTLPFNGSFFGGNTDPGAFGAQVTLAPTSEIVDFIRSTMKTYEGLAGGKLKFTEVSNDDQAAISFYYSKEIQDPDGVLLGMSTHATNGTNSWRNIFYNDGADTSYPGSALDILKNTIVHEVGHTVGFRHPVDYATDLFAEGGNGSNSVYAAYETIMSYNRDYPYQTELTSVDVAAYNYWWQSFGGTSDLASNSGLNLGKTNLYGHQQTAAGTPAAFDPIVGSAYIAGDFAASDQEDDVWRGGGADDKYVYRGGHDFAHGGAGEDVYYISPNTSQGYLSISDFTPGEDRLVFDQNGEYRIFSFGGATFVVGSDTDKVVLLKGQFTESQLLGGSNALADGIAWGSINGLFG